jgi:ABC-type Zn2+ transport system substrate-binding protein/surface adhesin
MFSWLTQAVQAKFLVRRKPLEELLEFPRWADSRAMTQGKSCLEKERKKERNKEKKKERKKERKKEKKKEREKGKKKEKDMCHHHHPGCLLIFCCWF